MPVTSFSFSDIDRMTLWALTVWFSPCLWWIESPLEVFLQWFAASENKTRWFRTVQETKARFRGQPIGWLYIWHHDGLWTPSRSGLLGSSHKIDIPETRVSNALDPAALGCTSHVRLRGAFVEGLRAWSGVKEAQVRLKHVYRSRMHTRAWGKNRGGSRATEHSGLPKKKSMVVERVNNGCSGSTIAWPYQHTGKEAGPMTAIAVIFKIREIRINEYLIPLHENLSNNVGNT